MIHAVRVPQVTLSGEDALHAQERRPESNVSTSKEILVDGASSEEDTNLSPTPGEPRGLTVGYTPRFIESDDDDLLGQ